jgi:hypothetical protein
LAIDIGKKIPFFIVQERQKKWAPKDIQNPLGAIILASSGNSTS